MAERRTPKARVLAKWRDASMQRLSNGKFVILAEYKPRADGSMDAIVVSISDSEANAWADAASQLSTKGK